jgi:hypothetical protein
MINRNFPADKKFEIVKHGNKNVKDYSTAYAKTYHIALNGMVARRMRSAILAVGSFWYSAWVDAGQPDLNKLIKKPLSTVEKKKIQREALFYEAGKTSKD